MKWQANKTFTFNIVPAVTIFSFMVSSLQNPNRNKNRKPRQSTLILLFKSNMDVTL